MTWQEEARTALHAHLWSHTAITICSCGWNASDRSDPLPAWEQHVTDALTAAVEAEVARAKVEALREVRDAWQQGQWTTLTPKLPTLETRMAAAQAVTDWLSGQLADAIEAEAGER